MPRSNSISNALYCAADTEEIDLGVVVWLQLMPLPGTGQRLNAFSNGQAASLNLNYEY
jgi:hypothetical protein